MRTSHTIVCILTCFSFAAGAAPETIQPPKPPVTARSAELSLAPSEPVAVRLAQAPDLPPPKGDIFFSRSKGRTLIIQSSDTDPKTYANLEEDLSVMYRILSKARRQDESSKLESLFSGASSSSVRSMYIEGYGAIFMMGVRFPLVAPQPSEEPPKLKDATSEEWERAKKELFSRNTFEVDVEHIWHKAIGPQVEEYDARKVEELTAGILESLKNAINIRNLKSDEFVTVAVLGAEANPARAVVEKEERGEDGKEKRKTRIEHTSGRGESTMTIRVKKSDIDDFAKGKLNMEAFRKKAKILAYLRPSDASGKMTVLNPMRQ